MPFATEGRACGGGGQSVTQSLYHPTLFLPFKYQTLDEAWTHQAQQCRLQRKAGLAVGAAEVQAAMGVWVGATSAPAALQPAVRSTTWCRTQCSGQAWLRRYRGQVVKIGVNGQYEGKGVEEQQAREESHWKDVFTKGIRTHQSLIMSLCEALSMTYVN